MWNLIWPSYYVVLQKQLDRLEETVSMDSFIPRFEAKKKDQAHMKWLIDYSRDSARRPLFKAGMKIPEFYSPPVRSGKHQLHSLICIERVRIANFAPKRYGEEIKRELHKRKTSRRPASLIDKSNYMLEWLLKNQHIDL